MKIKALHPEFRVPVRSSVAAGGYDLFMPEDGNILPGARTGKAVPLGFAAEIPPGYVALLLPRSGAGAKHGVSLNNTVGVIDSDYRGEWVANLRIRNDQAFHWRAGDRLLQFILVPVATVNLMLVTELDTTERGTGGFGSTGE